MIKFINVNTGELKTAFSATENNGKVYIRFTEKGKEYAYKKENIKIIFDEKDMHKVTEDKFPFTIYTFKKQCHMCHRHTDIITYIKFSDGTYDDVIYPWDKKRLLKNQNVLPHIFDPSIEYYGLIVVGDCEKYDKLLMDKFPDKIKIRYSATVKKAYPMNICSHCGAHQGNNYIYRYVNVMIESMQKINMIEC